MARFIEVIGWSKYNGRKDVSNPSWFRLQNKIFFDPEWDAFDGQEIAVWIYFLSFCSFKNKNILEFDKKNISKRARVPEAKVETSISKLLKMRCLRISEETHVTDTLRISDEHVTLHNITRHNRTEQDKTLQDTTALEQVQHDGSFDNKTGNPILENLLKLVKPSTQEAWLAAYPDQEWIKTELLKAHAWIDVNPKKAPKHFPRFMGNWLARGWEQYRKTLQSQNPKTAYKGIKSILDEAALDEVTYAHK